MTRLRELISIKHGYAFSGEHISDIPNRYVLLTPGNFRIGGGFKRGRLKFYDGPVPDEYILKAGDLIVTMTDLSKNMDTLGYPALVPDMVGDLVPLHNQRLGLIHVFSPLVDKNWLYYRLCCHDYRSEVMASSTGTTVHHTSPSRILDFELELPRVDEQRAIAATLRVIDDKIDSNRRAIELLEQLARAEFGKLFDVSLAHGGVALSALMEVNPRRSLKSGEVATYVGMASLPEFSAEIYKWELKTAGSGQRFINGDVLMARITPCLENGKTAVVDVLDANSVGWGSTEFIVLAPKGKVSTAWIYCLVRDERVRSFAIRSMSGTSGRQRFQADRFEQYKVAPPSEQALVDFNQLARPMFMKMTQLRDENLSLIRLRDALLPELLSGRIRITEAQEAAA